MLALVCSTLSLRWFNPLTSAFMLEARWDAFWAGDHSYHTEYHWVSLEQISPQAAVAVIASEDQNFPYHAGFDIKSIRAAVRAHEQGHALRGASTITQQLARNLYLSPAHSFFRKGLEAGITVLLEAFLPKERILELYLNIVEFGPGIYGVEAAAQHFYHRPAARLGARQAALLAAVLPAPRRFRVDAPTNYLRGRQAWILHQMYNLGGADYLDELTP